MLGFLHEKQNQKVELNESESYWRVLVYTKRDGFETLLLTESDLSRVRDRSSKNAEDGVKPKWIDRLVSWIKVGSAKSPAKLT